jgi:hypothetical protein
LYKAYAFMQEALGRYTRFAGCVPVFLPHKKNNQVTSLS